MSNVPVTDSSLYIYYHHYSQRLATSPAGRPAGADPPRPGGVLRVPGGDAAVPPVPAGSQGPPGAVPGGVRGVPARG